MSGLFKVFFEREFDNYAGERCRQLRAEIEAADRDYIAGVDCDRYVEYLVSKYSIDPLILSIDNVSVSDVEVEVPAAQFPPMFSTQPGRQYKKPAVRYHIPFVGDPELLLCKPKPENLLARSVRSHSADPDFARGAKL